MFHSPYHSNSIARQRAGEHISHTVLWRWFTLNCATRAINNDTFSRLHHTCLRRNQTHATSGRLKLSIEALATFAVNTFDRYYQSNVLHLHKDDKIALTLGVPGTIFLSNYMIWGLLLATNIVDHFSHNWRFELY